MKKIFEPNDSTIDDAPFTDEFKSEITLIGGGNLQPAYKNEIGVLHIGPTSINLTMEESIVCNRWVPQKKQLRVANNQLIAKHFVQEQNLQIPAVLAVGEVRTETHSFPYWYEQLLPGVPLTIAMFEDAEVHHYGLIMQWAARFHQKTEEHVSLHSFYESRLAAIQDCLVNSDLSRGLRAQVIWNLVRKGQSLRESLDQRIDVYEKVSMVHGDLRGGNILVYGQDVGIIDFEQGTHGGDWFVDITKLLRVLDDSTPNRKFPYKYRPNITRQEKSLLMFNYAKFRATSGWVIPRVINIENRDFIKGRNELIEYDSFVSILILRNLMGWNFQVEGNKRGTEFILDILEDQEWYNN